LLSRIGWNVEEQGLFGAPQISVIVGDEVHVSLLKALSLLGLGRSRVIRVPTDEQGRMRADLLPPLNDRSIVCIQAGNVNTGAFDPASEICSLAHQFDAWVHVDGAFGLWARAAPERAHLTTGFGEADSWATDCHKWLNVPYDSGLAFVREPLYLRSAMMVSAAYLQTMDDREPSHFTPESSRRARVIEVWAALFSLGRQGLAELIERNCQLALRMGNIFRAAGYQILNDIVLNQVLVSFGASDTTRNIVSEVQREGTCWCGVTDWHGKAAMRISVSCWTTNEQDVDESAAAILRIAEREVTLRRDRSRVL
jgi:glutamate/tyrosine decarboxylase-like PLP-dependent enzyme